MPAASPECRHRARHRPARDGDHGPPTFLYCCGLRGNVERVAQPERAIERCADERHPGKTAIRDNGHQPRPSADIAVGHLLRAVDEAAAVGESILAMLTQRGRPSERGPPRTTLAVILHRCFRRYDTASLAAFTGRALMILRAGFALNIVGSFVNGLMPLRSFVAGFLMTTNLANPGTKKAPVFLSSL
jgi:hypothetical protein